MKYPKEEVKHATEMLKKYAPRGATIFCVLRNVSRSGMARRIDFYVIDDSGKNPRLQWLTGWMCVLFGQKMGEKQGMLVQGCGMDMGFHMVDTLASALYGRDHRGIGTGLRHEWV